MKVKISGVDHFGRGITNINGKTCFVDNALKDEIVDIDIFLDKKRYMEAKVVRIISKSPKRVESDCIYFPLCGGCNLRYMNDSLKSEFKINKVREILSKFGGIDSNLVKEVIYSDKDFYRNKVVFHVKDKKLGFYKKKSHDVIDIDKCLNLDFKINEMIPKLKDIVLKNDIYEIMVRVGNISGEILVSIKGNVNDNIKIGDVLYINDELKTDKFCITSIIGNKKYLVSKDDFFQVNEYVTKILYDEVFSIVKRIKAHNVLDLYCGTGSIGIYISEVVDRVLGIEVVKSSVEKAFLNKDLNNIKNISFKEGKVEDVIDKVDSSFDTLICDPPRSGLKENVVQSIKRINPENIIYISCDPSTLARDIKLLSDNYQVEYIKVFDMFKNTYHVESLTLLSKKSK